MAGSVWGACGRRVLGGCSRRMSIPPAIAGKSEGGGRPEDRMTSESRGPSQGRDGLDWVSG